MANKKTQRKRKRQEALKAAAREAAEFLKQEMARTPDARVILPPVEIAEEDSFSRPMSDRPFRKAV